MIRFVTMSIAALALSVVAAGSAAAAPKASGSESTCTAGVGKYVCCKAGVADHCGHVSCCEVGNAAFFTKKSCSSCASHKTKQAAHHSAPAKASGSACSASAASCEVGNRRFFSKQSNCCSTKDAGASACCAGEKKAK